MDAEVADAASAWGELGSAPHATPWWLVRGAWYTRENRHWSKWTSANRRWSTYQRPQNSINMLST